jgi:Ca2+:H+ antiporter
MVRFLRHEWLLLISVATVLVFWRAGPALFADLANPLWLAVVFAWLFAVVLGSALAVVRHADRLAARLGEPYGTLVLTLAVTSIEVLSLSAVMLHGASKPTLVRDTLFAVVMIILNGMVGLSLLAGGWRHREQTYNLHGANAYLGVIVPLAVLSLVLPDFTQSTPGPTLSLPQQVFLILTSVGLYGAFLAIQTGRHRGYFTLGGEPAHGGAAGSGSPWRHAALTVLYIVPVVFLAEQLAHPIDYIIDALHVPDALGGLVLAILVAAPEAIGATRAAVANHLQRAVNIFLGSVLATIGLTVPAMIVVAHVAGRDLELGLQHTDLVLLLLTLAVNIVTFASGRTNVLQGLVHLLLFAAYVLLLIQG